MVYVLLQTLLMLFTLSMSQTKRFDGSKDLGALVPAQMGDNLLSVRVNITARTHSKSKGLTEETAAAKKVFDKVRAQLGFPINSHTGSAGEMAYAAYAALAKRAAHKDDKNKDRVMFLPPNLDKPRQSLEFKIRARERSDLQAQFSPENALGKFVTKCLDSAWELEGKLQSALNKGGVGDHDFKKGLPDTEKLKTWLANNLRIAESYHGGICDIFGSYTFRLLLEAMPDNAVKLVYQPGTGTGHFFALFNSLEHTANWYAVDAWKDVEFPTALTADVSASLTVLFESKAKDHATLKDALDALVPKAADFPALVEKCLGELGTKITKGDNDDYNGLNFALTAKLP